MTDSFQNDKGCMLSLSGVWVPMAFFLLVGSREQGYREHNVQSSGERTPEDTSPHFPFFSVFHKYLFNTCVSSSQQNRYLPLWVWNIEGDRQ